MKPIDQNKDCNNSSLPWTGERFVPDIQGNVALEHLHRYAMARELAAEKVVLDISCGEGYGSALLAQVARRVIGIDISRCAVEHAARKYSRDNLEFRIGSCDEIPLADNSVNLVVSFETIEHHDQHESMMAEIKRVLRPDGVIIISSPEKYEYSVAPNYSNPFHIKELYRHEFERLMAANFKHVAIFGQRVVYGSGIFREDLPEAIVTYDAGTDPQRPVPGMRRPVYLIAVASDATLPPTVSSFFDQPVSESEVARNWSSVVADREGQIESLTQVVAEREGQIASLTKAIAEREGQIAGLTKAIAEREGQIESLTQVVAEREGQIAGLEAQLAAVYTSRSWSITVPVRAVGAKLWRMKERVGVVRAISRLALSNGLRAGYRLFRERRLILSSGAFDCDYYRRQYPDVAATRTDPALHYLLYGASEGRDPNPLFDTDWYLQQNPDVAEAGVNPLAHYLRFGMEEGRLLHKLAAPSISNRDGQIADLNQAVAEREGQVQALTAQAAENPSLTSKPLNQQHWGLLATPHTLFIANLIAERLRARGCRVTIATSPSDDFSLDCYIVICPQMFKSLPPTHKRIVFQMEQSISSRWFTKEYLQILRESLAVLEYNLHNIGSLTKQGISYTHIFYLPIGASLNYGRTLSPTEKKFDVLFYGDYKSSPRRQRMLDTLVKEFDVKIVTEVFAPAILDIIRQAKVVINLHYYEDALLEVPRIQECLSLEVPVLSETARDQHAYPELAQAVRFFEQGSVPAMLQSLKEVLETPIPHDHITSAVQQSARRFEFMFDRFLVGMDFIPNQQIKEMPLPTLTSQVVLSLPEIIHRRQAFQSENLQGFTFFDGIRKTPGWVGCALSYRALACKALEMGIKRLTVLEDDVLPPDDFQEKMNVVYEYLDEREGQWDIFAGLIADLHSQVKILNVEDFKNIRFVTINKMTSMVCNIYNQKALEILASWNFENKDVEHNTIDRYLESQSDLRVVVALPFLVGHREDVNSTVWGFQNTQYRNMIAKSQQKLQTKVWTHDEYQKKFSKS